MDGMIRITPDKERARSMLATSNSTLEAIGKLMANEYPQVVVTMYYDVVRELMSAILLADGYKTYGEGAHKQLIDYIEANYKQLQEYEIRLLDELRTSRNRILYYGTGVSDYYMKRREGKIKTIIAKLQGILKEKLN